MKLKHYIIRFVLENYRDVIRTIPALVKLVEYDFLDFGRKKHPNQKKWNNLWLFGPNWETRPLERVVRFLTVTQSPTYINYTSKSNAWEETFGGDRNGSTVAFEYLKHVGFKIELM